MNLKFVFFGYILKFSLNFNIHPLPTFKTAIMDWQEKDNALYKSFKFKDFKEAFAFMTKVAAVAEKHQHHPRWTNVYNKLEIWLNTHDAGDVVTEKDRKLADEIDKL